MDGQQADTFIEPLTQREMDVLTLLAKGLSNQEIADTLVMEVGTIKWYNTQIYDKLQVENRKQAVARALTLGILEADIGDPLHRRQHNLPADTFPFIGRVDEINELVQQLTSEKYRLITILGPGGMGKTRLSIEVGRHLLGYFVDGVYFVPLTAITSTEQIVTTIADVIDFKFHSDAQPKQQLLAYLQNQHMLLIMDNFEHLLDHAGLLTDILKAAPKVKGLVTSREKLELGGEVVYVIGGLSTPFDVSKEAVAHDAVKLFIDSAGRTTCPIGDMDVVARICQLLGGMPLAILLAAAWLDTLSLAEIEAEIRNGLDILQSTLRDAPQRQQSIEAVFDYSWQRLTAHEQTIFMRLSVFREGFTREAAQDVTGANIRDLQRLVHTSFIQHLPSGRYDIHELIRQYGEQKLAASGELLLVRENHAHYFTRFMRPLGEAGWLQVERETLDLVSVDFENVRAAWNFYIERKDPDNMRLILDGIWVFMDAYSRSQEMIDMLEAVLDLFENDGGVDVILLRGQIVALLAWFSGDIGLKTEALELSQQALSILQPIKATDVHLLAYAALTIFLGMANKLPQELEARTRGLDLARQIGDLRWERIFCYLIATAHYALGHYQEALEWTERAPEIFSLGSKAAVLNKLGDYAQAADCLLRLLNMNLLHRYNLSNTYGLLLENAVLREDYEQAWRYLQRGLQYVDDASYAWAAHDLLQGALGLFSAEKHYPVAVEVLSLIVHHPNAMEITRAQAAAQYEDILKASLPADEFAAAWERGRHIDLGDLITELMEC